MRGSRPSTRGVGSSISTSAPTASPAPFPSSPRAAAARPAARSRASTTNCATHGTIAASANTAHMPSEKRQPAASATGTATSGGTNAATASSDEYSPVIVPTRSGKYFLMSGGSTTLPTPIAANNTAVPRRRARASDARARATIAPVATTIAATARRSRPKRRSRAGVTMPNTAKHTGGAAPISPRIHDGTAKSASISARIGESEATAERSEKATSTMPVQARSLPRQRERGRGSVTRSSLSPPERGSGGQLSCEPSTQARYSSVTVPVT